jgi:tRNA (guanosine-2'-O-)-methyltransferase
VAAAIVLQDVTARMRKSGVDWCLASNEKQLIYGQWLQKSIKSIRKILEHYEENIK